MSARVWVRRAYDPPGAQDGCRVLVDRLWPRGVSKDDAAIDVWAKDVAPSDELRRWYGHDPDRWEGFRTRYRAELEGPTAAALTRLVERAEEGRITLVFGARDAERSNAAVLRGVIDERLRA